jgi:hypothetical protein
MSGNSSSVPMTVDAPGANWSADHYTIDDAGSSVPVASADPRRRSVTVYNDADSIGTVFLMTNQGSTGGIRLVPGAGFDFMHGAAIYARATGGDAVVNVVAETGWSC